MIRNKRLARPTTLTFLSYLEQNFPVPNLTVKFQKEAVMAHQLPNGKMFYIKGSSYATELVVSTIEQTAETELRTLAHEYKHCLQHIHGTHPPKFTVMVQGRPATLNLEAEADANLFAEKQVAKFLEGNYVK